MSDDFFYRPPGPKRPPRVPVRPLSAEALARLELSQVQGPKPVAQLPERGERITIRWPGGPHDFELIFEHEGDPVPWFGWHHLWGEVVSPERWHPRWWGPMAHLVDGVWTMLPRGGKISDVTP